MRLPGFLDTVLVLTLSSNAFTKSVYPYNFLNEILLGDKPLPEHCGKSPYKDNHGLHAQRLQKRIVGGQMSRNGEWPWLVSMLLLQDGEYEHLCGGTLIHPQWVLTAAHCFESFWAAILTDDPKAWKIRLGEHHMFEEDEDVEGHTDVEPEAIYFHPMRQPPKTLNLDIALVKLPRPVKLFRDVNVACLPRENDRFKPGTMCVTAGWGHTEEGGNVSNVVRHVAVPIVSDELCNLLYSEIDEFEMIIQPDQLCAGFEAGGKDACQYDSGGPMVCFDSKDNQWLLTGVVSTGFGCARNGFPGIYTKVSEFLPWIEETIGKHSK